jgi:hypothetical protein
MSPAERIQRAFELSELVQSAAESGLRRAYPEADDREIFLRAARQRLGRDLFHKVYGNVLPGDSATVMPRKKMSTASSTNCAGGPSTKSSL